VAFISTPTVFADEDSGFDLGALITTAFNEIVDIAPSLFTLALDTVTAIVEDYQENGFDLNNIISSLGELVVNVGAQIASVAVNVGFELLGPQLSGVIQGLLAGFDPFDASLLFDGDWKELATGKSDSSCDDITYRYKIDASEIKGFSEASITALKINEQTINDGEMFLDLAASLGSFGILIDFKGKVDKQGCKKKEEVSFTAAYEKPNVGLEVKVEINAFVEGKLFNLTSAVFSEVAFESEGETMGVEQGFEEVEDELTKKMLLDVNEYVGLLEEAADDVSSINTQIEELGLLPYTIDLPFEWPL